MSTGEYREGGEQLIKDTEGLVKQAERLLERACRENDPARVILALDALREIQVIWLELAQGASLEKARAIAISFALVGELSRWLEEGQQGPPPSLLSLYEE